MLHESQTDSAGCAAAIYDDSVRTKPKNSHGGKDAVLRSRENAQTKKRTRARSQAPAQTCTCVSSNGICLI